MAMNKDFNKRTAIVTGAGQGIGYEICKQLVGAGATVLLNDIDENLALSAAARITETGGKCIACPGDASDPKVIQWMIGQAVAENGLLDMVIANAGITSFGDFFTYTVTDLSKVLQVNLVGTFLLTQAAANQMKGQPKGGSILFTSSVTGHQAHKDLAAYGMTKAALEMLAKSLVLELSPFRININTVVPGATLTERTANDPDYERQWSEITPMGRPAHPRDIADAALFLVSDKARHITGQSLIVDGGWTATSPSPA
ncbi:SDR family oxidoreductase [Olivibacter sp. CPCC 100613]|uniref:SDR family NAD(P)-dependent oxidoreductase n=1 Tax=Olivibacter sp. CPCC 100613 TaxID=3079931 RepID=UPI002FF6C371